MKVNKLKYLLIAAFCVITSLPSEIQCMDGEKEEIQKEMLTGNVTASKDVKEELDRKDSEVIELSPQPQLIDTSKLSIPSSPEFYVFTGNDLEEPKKEENIRLPRKWVSEKKSLDRPSDDKKLRKSPIALDNTPIEVYSHILSFLDSDCKEFLKARLINKGFDAAAKLTPCTLELQWRISDSYCDTERLENVRTLLGFNVYSLVLKNFPAKEIIFDDIGKNLYNLRLLDLTDSKKIGDNIFFYFSKLEKLEQLKLDGLQISDRALRYFKEFHNFTEVSLEDTFSTIRSLEYLKNSQNLTSINLRKSKTSPKSSRSTGHNTSLDYLSSFTSLNSDIRFLGNFPYLSSLDLTGHPLNNTGLKHLSNLCSGLQVLRLASTDITDDGLEYIRNLPKLSILNLAGTKITFDGVRAVVLLGGFENLQILCLDSIVRNNSNNNILFLKSLNKLRTLYLKRLNISIRTVLEYYENISGVKNQAIMGYKVILATENPIFSSKIPVRKKFLREIATSKENEVHVEGVEENFRITDEDRKAYYEELTGVKIITQ